jgi:hypothetical protein
MKLASLGAVAAAVAFGAAIADRAGVPERGATTSYPPGCTVEVNGMSGSLPRAGVTIENRLGRPARAWLEPRYGLPRVDFGTIANGQSRWFAHALPAGRILLGASAGDGPVVRGVLQVANRGAGTCGRRYLWRIEEVSGPRVQARTARLK